MAAVRRGHPPRDLRAGRICLGAGCWDFCHAAERRRPRSSILRSRLPPGLQGQLARMAFGVGVGRDFRVLTNKPGRCDSVHTLHVLPMGRCGKRFREAGTIGLAGPAVKGARRCENRRQSAAMGICEFWGNVAVRTEWVVARGRSGRETATTVAFADGEHRGAPSRRASLRMAPRSHPFVAHARRKIRGVGR